VYSDIQQTLCLGGITNGVKNIEINGAYSTIANGGVYIKPKLYTKILDHEGNVILDNTSTEGEQVLKPSTAYLLTSAMQDVVTSGTGTAVNFGKTDIAAKTGTTTGDKDAWLCGFTNYYTASCWAGYDNNEKLRGTVQTHLAKTLWKKVMSQIHESLPAAKFQQPDDVVTATVCRDSGLLPTPGICDAHLKTEFFEKGTIPTEACNVHIYQTICNYSGLLATDLCPFKVQQVVTVAPEEPEVLKQGAGGGGGSSLITQYCPHDANFMAQPNAQEILVQQNQELVNRIAAQNGGAVPQAQPNETPAPAEGQPPAEGESLVGEPVTPGQDQTPSEENAGG
jgi:penicillin-binding protein 1A